MNNHWLYYVFAPLSLSQWNLYPLWWLLSRLQNFRQIQTNSFPYKTEIIRLPLSISGDPLGLEIEGEAAKGTEICTFSEDPKANIPTVFFESRMEYHQSQNQLEFYEKFGFPGPTSDPLIQKCWNTNTWTVYDQMILMNQQNHRPNECWSQSVLDKLA